MANIQFNGQKRKLIKIYNENLKKNKIIGKEIDDIENLNIFLFPTSIIKMWRRDI